MQYRRLGKSGLKISAFNFGSVTFGGQGAFSKAGNVERPLASRMIDLCIEHGVNLFDTADVYSSGKAEEILGEVLKGRSSELLVASKVRFTMGTGPNEKGLSRYHIIKACEASLKRLQREVIDLYYLHEWDGQTPPEEMLEALWTLREQGKIRYVGVSNFSAWQVMKLMLAAKGTNLVTPVAEQIYYSLESRDAEYELLPLAADQGLGVQVWSPLACGLLTGKYRRGHTTPEDSRRIQGWSEPEVRNLEKLHDVVEVLVDIAEAHSVSPAQVALSWTVNRPAITSLVLGARREEQLLDNLKSIDLVLSDEETLRLEKVSAPDLIYPYWHQHNTASDRLSEADKILHGPASRVRQAKNPLI